MYEKQYNTQIHAHPTMLNQILRLFRGVSFTKRDERISECPFKFNLPFSQQVYEYYFFFSQDNQSVWVIMFCRGKKKQQNRHTYIIDKLSWHSNVMLKIYNYRVLHTQITIVFNTQHSHVKVPWREYFLFPYLQTESQACIVHYIYEIHNYVY